MVRHFEISSLKSCLNVTLSGISSEKNYYWSGWLCWVRGCGWLDSTSCTSAGGKDADLTFGSLVWW